MQDANDFTDNIPLASLPAEFRNAVHNSANGTQTSATDRLIGSIYEQGFCSNAQYRYTPYCACVNTTWAWPPCLFKPCKNNANAYKPLFMKKWLDEKKCPGADYICKNLNKLAVNSAELHREYNCPGTPKEDVVVTPPAPNPTTTSTPPPTPNPTTTSTPPPVDANTVTPTPDPTTTSNTPPPVNANTVTPTSTMVIAAVVLILVLSLGAGVFYLWDTKSSTTKLQYSL